MILDAGDYILLCSDGLTDLVSDDEINSSIDKYPLDEAIDSLVKLANSRGGHDNITIIGIKVPDDKVNIPPPRRRNRLILMLIIFSMLVLAILAAWIFQTYFNESDSDRPIIFPGETSGISEPTLMNTVVTPILPSPTVEITEEESLLSPTPAAPTGASPVPATYTPWPTSTPVP